MSPPGSPGRARRRTPATLPVGELALINLIRRRAGKARSPQVRLGIGDDCAILRPRPGEDLVVTTDLCLEGRHFRQDWHPPVSVGHRTLARGLSDLAAMGARPVAAFLSLALPLSAAANPAWINGFLDGFLELATRCNVPLAGGDTSGAPGENILADIVLLGAVPAGHALRRSGARAGDRLFCTGDLGGAAAELLTLRNGSGTPRKPRTRPKLTPENPHPQLFPEPRLAIGRALVRRGLASAAMDLSDGLSTDLLHLCQASGLSAEIFLSALPLHPLASALGAATAQDLALNGGEDYELLFAAPPDKRIPRSLAGVRITEIGRFTPQKGRKPNITAMAAEGIRTELRPGGWEHLR